MKATVTFNKESGQVIIPKAYLELLNISKDGNRKVDITFKDGAVIITPVNEEK